MRKVLSTRVEDGRVTDDSQFGTENFSGPTGMYRIRLKSPPRAICHVMASDGSDWDCDRMGPLSWEHVSVSILQRCPTWDEMEEIRNLFWLESEWVLQFSPPRDERINIHPTCLHLWRAIGTSQAVPPRICL